MGVLREYKLNGPSVVILDDGRDPFVSWRNHLARTGGLRGGVDLVAKVGTPIYAPTRGIMNWLPDDGGAGNSCRFLHKLNPGWADVFSHLDSYVGRNGQLFEQDELIAYSGDTGGVTQHLHRHLLDPQGNRKNPWAYFSQAALAGVGVTALPTMKKGTMKLIWAGSTGYLLTDDGIIGLPSPQVYNLFYRVINSDQTKSPFNQSGTPDMFNKAEVDIMAGQLRLLTVSANTGVPIDVDKLAKTLGLALGATFDPTVEIEAGALAAAFEVALPKIAAAVNRDAAARLSA